MLREEATHLSDIEAKITLVPTEKGGWTPMRFLRASFGKR